MPERRIQIPKKNHAFVQSLIDSDDGNGPFRTQAEVLAFAAALGARYGKFEPFEEHAGDPIRQDIFIRAGYDTLINLLAIHCKDDPVVLANNEIADDQRITIFESYANGGLDFLKNELKGEIDYTEGLMLLLKKERVTIEEIADDDLDITDLGIGLGR
jgi:dnd system-associated protein 4